MTSRRLDHQQAEIEELRAIVAEQAVRIAALEAIVMPQQRVADTITQKEAANALDISIGRVSMLIKEEKLRGVRVGGRMRVCAKSVAARAGLKI